MNCAFTSLNGLLLNCPREGRGGLFSISPKKRRGGGLIRGRGLFEGGLIEGLRYTVRNTFHIFSWQEGLELGLGVYTVHKEPFTVR